MNDIADMDLEYIQKSLLRLQKEFYDKFTIMGGGSVLDEITNPKDLWEWITDNFSPVQK